jgi:tripartite ATP-independent transporter DctM subunit
LMAGLYMLYVIVITRIKPHLAPDLPPEAFALAGRELFNKVIRVIIPPGILIFAVLGSIFFGLASPTEAGSVGAVGACLLALMNKRFSYTLIQDAARSTAQLTSLVITILFCSSFFSLVFDGLGGQRLITDLLVNLPGGYWTFIIVANIAIFLLGVFLEFVEICFIAMPLFVPAAQALGIDMVWLAVVFAINLQTAFISPPVGFSLFYLQTTAPKEVTTADIHKGALPFMVLQLIALIIVLAFPQTVTWLIDLSAQTAP